ncbi:MAG: peptidoglycan DD-metalloendopeptidase family protein [Lachnospirales bacterium]
MTNNKNNNPNNKKKGSKKSNAKENAMILGLYGVVGALVITAGVLTARNFYENNEMEIVEEVNEDTITTPVISDTTKSYKDEVEVEVGEIGIAVSTNVANVNEELAKNDEEQKEDDSIKENPSDTDSGESQKESPELNDEDEKDFKETDDLENENLREIEINENSETKDLESEKDNSESETGEQDESKTTETDDSTEKSTVVEEYVETNSKALYTAFDEENDVMLWPTDGDVVMPYSDTLIFDTTLEQYRTNDTVRISSPLGYNVVSVFDGEVVDVGNSYDDGNFIVVSHGNGWNSVYSQLDGQILVSKGEVITKGQIIGTVANPSRKYSTLNSHLGFKLSKNDEPINPAFVLGE